MAAGKQGANYNLAIFSELALTGYDDKLRKNMYKQNAETIPFIENMMFVVSANLAGLGNL